VSSTNFLRQAGSSGYRELTAIASDPAMRRLARRVAGELFEDVLQETWYLVAQACARGPIANLSGYFYRVMVNTSRRMQGELTRNGATVIDVETAGTSRHSLELAAPSAESDALPLLLAATRRAILRCRRIELWQAIPACSPAPDRYRAVILAVTETMVTGEGPINRAEINNALVTEYPEWFDAPGVTVSTIYQRRCRARESIRQILVTLIDPGNL
jgi:DNA-directed RNA polymerase specialized sigma24 family protein